MQKQRDEADLGKHFHPSLAKKCLPCGVVARQCEQEYNQRDGVNQHQHRGGALHRPIAQAVVCAGKFTVYHSHTPKIAVQIKASAITVLAVVRAVFSARPLCASKNRKRMPAKKWCK